MPKTTSKQQVGVRGEDFAFAERERQDMEILKRNWRQTLRQLAALWQREHHFKASTVRLDAVGVVLVPGQPPFLTLVRAVG